MLRLTVSVVLCGAESDPSQPIPAAYGEMAAGPVCASHMEDYLMSGRLSC